MLTRKLEIGMCVYSYSALLDCPEYGHVIRLSKSTVLLSSNLIHGGIFIVPRNMPVSVHVLKSTIELAKKVNEVGFPDPDKDYSFQYKTIFKELYKVHFKDEFELQMLIKSLNILTIASPELGLPVIGRPVTVKQNKPATANPKITK